MLIFWSTLLQPRWKNVWPKNICTDEPMNYNNLIVVASIHTKKIEENQYPIRILSIWRSTRRLLWFSLICATFWDLLNTLYWVWVNWFYDLTHLANCIYCCLPVMCPCCWLSLSLLCLLPLHRLLVGYLGDRHNRKFIMVVGLGRYICWKYFFFLFILSLNNSNFSYLGCCRPRLRMHSTYSKNVITVGRFFQLSVFWFK